MQNAMTALMMAAGVLIGILLLSVMVVAFNGAAELARSYDESVATTSLQAFNNNFEKSTLGEIDIQEIITMVHFAKDYNYKNNLVEEDSIYISVICNHKNLEKKTDDQLLELMKNNSFYIEGYDSNGNIIYVKDEHGDIIKKKYKCKSIEYNEKTGAVIKIEFEEVKL